MEQGPSMTLGIGGYPRPQLRRSGWTSFDGEFTLQADRRFGELVLQRLLRVCHPRSPVHSIFE
jgi:hypothetical protein